MIDLRRLAPALVLVFAACSQQQSPVAPAPEVRPPTAPASTPADLPDPRDYQDFACWPGGGCNSLSSPAASPVTSSVSWGAIWRVAGGAAVLRPTWMPEDGASETRWRAVTASYGLTSYHVSYAGRDDGSPPHYYARRDQVSGRWFTFIAQTETGPTPWWLISESIPRSPGQGGGATEVVTVRGRLAELITRDHPYVDEWTLQLSWSEDGYRYAIQASFRSSPDELLRIADSLRPVVDASGGTAAARRTGDVG